MAVTGTVQADDLMLIADELVLSLMNWSADVAHYSWCFIELNTNIWFGYNHVLYIPNANTIEKHGE